MFMLNNGGAMCLAAPDVCKVPTPAGPVPMPFPNMGTTQMADPGKLVKKVLVSNMPAMNQATALLMTSGDEPGVAGGVMSSKFKGKAEFKKGSSKVMVGGKPALSVGAPTAQNATPANAVGAVIKPSQFKVMVMG